MKRLTSSRRAPGWARQATRAAVALVLGVLVGLSAGQPTLLLVAVVVILMAFITASLRTPNPLVFVGFVALTMPGLRLPGSPLPMGELLMVLAVFSAFMTLRTGEYRLPRWARLALGVLVATVVASTMVNGLFDYDAFKRIMHIAVWVLVIVGLVRGLLPRAVALRGLQVGMIVSVLSGYLLLPNSTYAGRFTGLFNDPNVAGLFIVVVGSVALSGIERTRNRVWFVVWLLPALLLTYSRTAILAAIVVGLWLLVGRRMRAVPAFGLVVLVAVAIALLPTSLQSFGPFSDRAGSDQLRNRVATEEWNVVREKPVLGHGAGTATVMVNFGTTRFYFHNSYLAAVQEGGVITLGALLVLSIGTFLALLSLATTQRQPLLGGAIIGIWVIAINLGEVLLALSAAVAIGFALSYAVRARDQDRTGPPLRVGAAR